jgi:hypothetical protein
MGKLELAGPSQEGYIAPALAHVLGSSVLVIIFFPLKANLEVVAIYNPAANLILLRSSTAGPPGISRLLISIAATRLVINFEYERLFRRPAISVPLKVGTISSFCQRRTTFRTQHDRPADCGSSS